MQNFPCNICVCFKYRRDYITAYLFAFGIQVEYALRNVTFPKLHYKAPLAIVVTFPTDQISLDSLNINKLFVITFFLSMQLKLIIRDGGGSKLISINANSIISHNRQYTYSYISGIPFLGSDILVSFFYSSSSDSSLRINIRFLLHP